MNHRMTSIQELLEIGVNRLKFPQDYERNYKTGFKHLDETIPFKDGELVVIGARPGMGKSAFMLSLALNFAKEYSVIYHSTEHSHFELFQRIIAQKSGIDMAYLRGSKLEEYKMKVIEDGKEDASTLWMDFLDGYPEQVEHYFIDIKAKLAEESCDILVLDCADILGSSMMYASPKIKWRMLEGLKQLKKFCEARAILLIISSQLSRQVESRQDKRPVLSDLFLTGLEVCSDKIAFLYRPEYYGITQDHEGNDLSGYAEFIVRLNKKGMTGSCSMHFNNRFGKFEQWQTQDYGEEGDSNSFESFKEDIKEKINEVRRFEVGGAPF
ncbi:hypothetical protein GYB22_04450 [bacterium]|nr:hypothetical protein [bacterium]